MPKNNDLYTNVLNTIDAWHKEQVVAGTKVSEEDIRSDVTEAAETFLTGNAGSDTTNTKEAA